MAEPGDPTHPEDDAVPEPGANAPAPSHDWDDDHVGFASPGSLAGRPTRLPEPEPEPEPQPEPEPEAPVLDRASAEEPDLFDAASEPEPELAAAPPPQWSVETPVRDRTPPQPGGAMNLYAIYALILFAVPTLGVSAVIGLLAVTGREAPADPIARSHFIFQQRTLWAAAVVALLGAILVVVNIGVFVLFVLAVWIILRGAMGVFRLKAGQPIRDPRHWLI